MLPFLKEKKEAVSAAVVEPVKRAHDEEYGGLNAAADDLIAAIHAKDSPGVVAALRAAFDICESEPHEESNDV